MLNFVTSAQQSKGVVCRPSQTGRTLFIDAATAGKQKFYPSVNSGRFPSHPHDRHERILQIHNDE